MYSSFQEDPNYYKLTRSSEIKQEYAIKTPRSNQITIKINKFKKLEDKSKHTQNYSEDEYLNMTPGMKKHVSYELNTKTNKSTTSKVSKPIKMTEIKRKFTNDAPMIKTNSENHSIRAKLIQKTSEK